MTALTDEALAELERLDAAMRPAPWHAGTGHHYSREVRADDRPVAFCGSYPKEEAYANAAGIVVLRNSAAVLLAEVRRLRAVESAALAYLDCHHGPQPTVAETLARHVAEDALEKALVAK